MRSHAEAVPHPTPDLRGLSFLEHARLEGCFTAVLDEVVAGNQGDLAPRWSELAHTLTEHMALEEREILPIFAHVAPAEAAALRQEHAAIRRDLEELGVCVDLHVLSPQRAGDFIARLRAHALREDAMLYRYAASQRLTATR